MEYQSLGRTGVQVSPLCLGGMLFGEQTDEAEALAIIDRALDAGLNFLDTANIYNRGRSEEIIGRALRLNGRRARVVLATKVHGTMDAHDPNAWGTSRRHIVAIGCSSQRPCLSLRSKSSRRSSPRIVRPACREAQVAYVHQFAPSPLRAANAAASPE